MGKHAKRGRKILQKPPIYLIQCLAWVLSAVTSQHFAANVMCQPNSLASSVWASDREDVGRETERKRGRRRRQKHWDIEIYAKRLRQSQRGKKGGGKTGGREQEREAGKSSSSTEHTIAEWSCETGCACLLQTLLFVCWPSCTKGKPSKATAFSLRAGIHIGADVARLLQRNFAHSHVKAVTALSLTCSPLCPEGERKRIKGGLFGP